MPLRLALKILFVLFVFVGLLVLFLYTSKDDLQELRESGQKEEVIQVGDDNEKRKESDSPDTSTTTTVQGEDPQEDDISPDVEKKAREMIEKDVEESGGVKQDTREEIQEMVNEQIIKEKESKDSEQEEQEKEERQKERREIMKEVNENIN